MRWPSSQPHMSTRCSASSSHKVQFVFFEVQIHACALQHAGIAVHRPEFCSQKLLESESHAAQTAGECSHEMRACIDRCRH